jgi:symplekin
MAQPADIDQVAQLNAARNLVLGDAAFYPQIVSGILPIVGANTRLELRRWGADFLAETFASPVLAISQKEQLAPNVLQTIREILELPEKDTAVLQSLVQTSASLYPLVFRHMYVQMGVLFQIGAEAR